MTEWRYTWTGQFPIGGTVEADNEDSAYEYAREDLLDRAKDAIEAGTIEVRPND